MPYYPDCYDQWSLIKYVYDGDHFNWYPNHSPEVIEYLEEQVHILHKMADIMRHIDFLYSGDHGEDSFMERVMEVERKYG